MRGGPFGHHGNLIIRVDPPQTLQQSHDSVRISECGMCCGSFGQQRDDLIIRTDVPQPAQQPSHSKSGVCGGRWTNTVT